MISIITGKPGSGKTLFAVYLMYLDTILNGYDHYLKSCKEIEELNKNGYNFNYPKQKHVTYFNGQARFSPNGHLPKTTYMLDPWELGLPSQDRDVQLVFPFSKIYIDEAQRYYNSRLSYLFPDFVSRFFELHRHYGLDITLIAQRGGLIDLNIRELAEKLYYIEDLKLVKDSLGNMVSATWIIREFGSNADLEKYVNGNKELGEERIYTCSENLFKFYNTRFYKFLFLNRVENREFLDKSLNPFKYNPEICNKLSQLYSATAPENFYKKENKKEVNSNV